MFSKASSVFPLVALHCTFPEYS